MDASTCTPGSTAASLDPVTDRPFTGADDHTVGAAAASRRPARSTRHARSGRQPLTSATAAEHDARRRIGDILLELGFVTEKQLAKAAQEQDETGAPLGQILVEHGAITRLELASALAEQWSSHPHLADAVRGGAAPHRARTARAARG